MMSATTSSSSSSSSSGLLIFPMNVSSEAIAFPINHHRHMLNGTHPSIYANASPIAVNNKIRAIQARRSRITLQSYYDFTDIRPINLNNAGATTHSSTNFSNLSAQKLLERSKDVRLGHVPARHESRPSVLSSISTANQQSLIWPSYNSPNGFTKQSQINTPTMATPIPVLPNNKTSAHNMPDIHQRPYRTQTRTSHTLTEQQNDTLFLAARHKSLSKTKSSIPKANCRKASKVKSSYATPNNQPLQAIHKDDLKQSKAKKNENAVHLYESEEEEENIVAIDAEFEEYIQKSTMKCADWLLKYVVDKDFDYSDE
ncbi:unnamed protein product [Rotaria magnacalcarata]|uniref:Uncharacterized protein n=2 Tax=Rotaria magnacalcarata TaxID=392030 RepID=A0A816L5T0_9BILA|nr:unnamed protein product [Rotaria magnacalcarata]CAF4106652.1 unnamed protein product [Rotaria magnacalcarata]